MNVKWPLRLRIGLKWFMKKKSKSKSKFQLVLANFWFRAEWKKHTSLAELKIFQLELWLKPAWLGFIQNLNKVCKWSEQKCAFPWDHPCSPDSPAFTYMYVSDAMAVLIRRMIRNLQSRDRSLVRGGCFEEKCLRKWDFFLKRKTVGGWNATAISKSLFLITRQWFHK